MNDHNLDDLIIDNIEPKNSKTKSFLTIVALLIVVLIVAIILTKIILKNPDADRLALEENNTELISPELTLQNTEAIVEPKIPTHTVIKKPIVPKLVEENIAAPTIAISKESSQKPKVEKKPTPTDEQIEETPTKPKPSPKESSVDDAQAHYIQVGSFSKTPSKRFLSVITNSGFNYKITPSSNNGTKKLLIGPYKDKTAANTALVRVKDRINKSAFVIKK